jgi:hypothetical protein
VLKLSRQPYYRWLVAPISPSEVVEAYRANALFDAHRDDPEFGHRLLADEARDHGEAMSDRTAWRIASTNGWFSAFGKPKRGKHRKPGPPVHDDLCAVADEHGRTRHVFAADAPNQLWLTDITEHKTVQCSVISPIHNSLGAVAVNSCRVRPFSSTTAHRSSWTGGPGFFPLRPRFFPNLDHQPLSAQIRHAVRSAIGCPAWRASSARNR